MLNQVFLVLSYIFLGCLIFSSFLFLIFTILGTVKLSKYEKKITFSNILKHEYYVPLSIIIAAHNDENSILTCIESLLSLNYKLFEIIVVDDGSNDETVSMILNSFEMKLVKRPIQKNIQTGSVKEIYETTVQNIKITLLLKNHGGYADAYNVGINASNYPYVAFIKANYLLLVDTLEHLVRPVLESDDVIICNGLSSCGMVMDDVYTFPEHNFSKALAFSYNQESILKGNYGDISSIPTLSLFRKDMVVSVLGFDKGSIGENFELERKIKSYCYLNAGNYIFQFVPDALCFINYSDRMISLFQDRQRIYRGLFRSKRKYKKVFLNPKSKLKSFFSRISFAFLDRFYPYIFCVGVIALIFSFVNHIISFLPFCIFLFTYILLQGVLSYGLFLSQLRLFHYHVTFPEYLKGIFGVFLQVTIYRFFDSCSKFLAFFGF